MVPGSGVDGVPIADTLGDLIDSEIFTSISVTEKGEYVRSVAWTGTRWEGVAYDGYMCDDWSGGAGQGLLGQSNGTDGHWTWAVPIGACNGTLGRLYCFSQVIQVLGGFSDGFESGDVSAWSSSVP